jgi:hypothetical protein
MYTSVIPDARHSGESRKKRDPESGGRRPQFCRWIPGSLVIPAKAGMRSAPE